MFVSRIVCLLRERDRKGSGAFDTPEIAQKTWPIALRFTKLAEFS